MTDTRTQEQADRNSTASSRKRTLPRMFLVQLLLPVADNEGRAFARAEFDRVRHELTDRHGGVTAYLRAPAIGLWKDDEAHVSRDDVVIYEVMTDALDRGWWAEYRAELQKRFRQEEVVVRASIMERL